MIHRLIYGSNVIIAYVRSKMYEKATRMQTQCSIKCSTLKEEQPKDNDCINIFGCTSRTKSNNMEGKKKWMGGGGKGCRSRSWWKKSALREYFFPLPLSFNSVSLYMFIIEMENREKYEVKQERVRR